MYFEYGKAQSAPVFTIFFRLSTTMREEYDFSNAKKTPHASQLKKQVADEQKSWSLMKAEDFDQQFDDGADITSFLDLSKSKLPLQHPRTGAAHR